MSNNDSKWPKEDERLIFPRFDRIHRNRTYAWRRIIMIISTLLLSLLIFTLIVTRGRLQNLFGSAIPTPTYTTTSTPLPTPGTVLYQVNPSSGWDGWAGTSDWKVLNGVLLNDGSNNYNGIVDGAPTTIAPYIASQANYAVEVKIQVVTPTSTSCFGIDVRGTIASSWKGYIGGVYLSCTLSNHLLALSADTFTPYLTRASFDPGTSPHVYRIEAKDNHIRFLIDGVPVLSVTDNRHLSGGQVGLWCYNTQLDISSFKVISL